MRTEQRVFRPATGRTGTVIATPAERPGVARGWAESRWDPEPDTWVREADLVEDWACRSAGADQ